MKKLITPLFVLAVLICAAFAADTVSEQVTLQTSTRLSSINVTTEHTGEARIAIARETVRTVAGGVISRQPESGVIRNFTTIATDEVTLANGKKVKAAELYEAMVLFAAKWKAEDETPPTPPEN